MGAEFSAILWTKTKAVTITVGRGERVTSEANALRCSRMRYRSIDDTVNAGHHRKILASMSWCGLPVARQQKATGVPERLT